MTLTNRQPINSGGRIPQPEYTYIVLFSEAIVDAFRACGAFSDREFEILQLPPQNVVFRYKRQIVVQAVQRVEHGGIYAEL